MHGWLNLMAPEVRANPYPFYAELRRHPSLARVEPGGFWAVSRQADVLHVLKNPQLFSSTGNRVVSEPEWLGQHNPFAESIVMLDPPRHTRMRALVNRAFGPTALARLEPRVRAYAEEVAAALPAGRTVDFVESFALRVPAFVIGELLGLDAALHPRFKRWSDDIVSVAVTPPDALARQAEIRATFAEMEQYLRGVLEDRRRHPREDMLSDLLAADMEGEALSDVELMGFLFLLIVAGLETTIHLLGHSALVLARHPDVLARLHADSTLIPRFVEEVLRYEPPTHAVMRLTTAETELCGVHLAPGTPVVVLIGSACHDETVYPGADHFDLDRGGPQNMPFGHGIHFCLGAPLARMEARLALEALLARFGRLSRDAGPVQWNQSLVVRGPAVLPLTLWRA